MEINETSTLDFFPLFFKSEMLKYRVQGVGSHRSLLVTPDEAMALRLLRRKRSLGKSRELLSHKNHKLEIDYFNLAKRCIDARIVHKVDDVEIERPYATPLKVWRDKIRLWSAAVKPAFLNFLVKVSARLMPITWTSRLTQWALLATYPSLRKQRLLAKLSEYMNWLFPDAQPAERMVHSQAFFWSQEIHKNVELLMLLHAPHPRIGPWARNLFDELDLGPLDEMLALGKGVILFHFHLGPVQMISVVLTALEYKVTILGMSTSRVRETDMYMDIVDDLGPAGIMKLLQALAQNEVVLISPDPELKPVETPDQDPEAFRERFAGSWDRRSELELPFFNYKTRAPKGIAWLHEQSGAPLLYAQIHRPRRGRLNLSCQRFNPPARGLLKKKAWHRAIMLNIFALYENQLRRQPGEWEHWFSFFRGLKAPEFCKDQLAFLSQRGQNLIVQPDDRIQFHRYSVRPYKDEKKLIVRMGTPSVMLVDPIGLHALTLFRKGASCTAVLDDLKRNLGQELNTPRLYEFLRVAYKAGLVLAVNQVRVKSVRVQPGKWLMHMFKAHLYPSLFSLVDKHAPLVLREKVLPWLHWRFETRFKYLSKKQHLGSNLRRLFPDKEPALLKGVLQRHVKHMTRSELTLSLTQRKVTKVFRWLDLFVEPDIEGFDQVEALRREGKGIIFAGFHFGFYWMMPALLFKLGFEIHAMIGTVLQSEDQLENVGVPGYPNAAIRFYDTNVQNVASFTKKLEAGGSVLLYADSLSPFNPEITQFTHKTWGKFTRSKKEATLFNFPFPIQPGVAWLHRHGGAPILPVILFSPRTGGKARLVFGKPIQASEKHMTKLGFPALPEQEVLDALCAQLTLWIRQYPDQWSNLMIFPKRP